jgi:hypothetical protein
VRIHNIQSVAFLIVWALAASTQASILWDQSTDGSLSTNQSAPTPLTAVPGINSVIGIVGTTNGVGNKENWLALTIPTGYQLSSDVLESYVSTDMQGFTGFQDGSSFVGNPETTPGAYVGYTHFGTGATNGSLPATNLVGVDLLPLMANPAIAAGAQGFTPPLPAGTYTFFIQQLGATTNYQFDYGVTAVPEPASLSVMGIGGIALLGRRRVMR